MPEEKKSAAKKAAAKKPAAKTAATKKPATKAAASKTAAKAVDPKSAAKPAAKAPAKKPARKTPPKLVIVESPAKAKTISKYLGSSYHVVASQGHIRDLPKSQLGIDIDDDFDMKYITIRGRGDILKEIRNEAAKAGKIYLATDPDREGEAISWHLAQILGIDGSSPCRIEFHEVTEKAVKQAIQAPRPLNLDLVDAQQARRALDRLVGYKISPLLWVKVKKGLSAGRVQSVATQMVVSREQDINDFVPEEYWTIFASGKAAHGRKTATFRLRLSAVGEEKAEIRNKEAADALLAETGAQAFTIAHVKESTRRKLPAPPFTTSSLQQEAGRKLNFTTAKTMQVVQTLYEGVDLHGEGTQGLVTYIRTDSVRISDGAMEAVRAFIPERFGEEYLPAEPNVYKGRKNAQDAHEAIRPTDVNRSPAKIRPYLTNDQYKLYELIYNRFIASQMKPAEYKTLNADAVGGRLTYHFYGEHKTFAGFTALYEESRDEEEENNETNLPELHEGDAVTLSDLRGEQHFTQPPSRYTEATLVRALEEQGIGRPSTYAPTISTIISRGYVSREQKRLYPTELGNLVTEMMRSYFPDIVDIGFTAEMENELDDIEAGSMPWKKVLRDFYPAFREELAKAEAEIEKVTIEPEVSDVACDKCGAMMVYRLGRYGRFLACPRFPACRNTLPIVNYLDTPCPKCGGRLMEKTSKKNRIFYGCEKYPDCDFVSWDRPVPEKCPACGTYMIEKRNRKGEVWHVCTNDSCRYREEIAQAQEADE